MFYIKSNYNHGKLYINTLCREGNGMEEFRTVEERREGEQVVNKSRFIAIIVPISTTDEVEKELDRVRRDYPNARHYVYAYRIHEGRLEKSSDDGEPQGTGGKPVMDLLQHKGLWNVLLIVVRYFGGILLGTGGLVRAYGGTARQVVEQAAINHLISHHIYRITVSYSWYDTVKYNLQKKGWVSGKEEFDAMVGIECFIPETETDDFHRWLDELTDGQGRADYEKTVFRRPS